MKYILFVVEGPSDSAFYAPIIKKLIKDKYQFKIVRTDMTSEISDKFQYKVGKDLVEYVIKNKTSRDYYDINSISKIVMIMDIDGCYVHSRLIRASSKRGTRYYSDHIETYNPKNLQCRNTTKQRNIRELKDCKYLFGDKPFELYYNCVNLDHVISNERNMPNDEKESNADKVGKYYAKNLPEYLELLMQILPAGDLQSSWKYLKKSTNSLERLSNFYYFIDDCVMASKDNNNNNNKFKDKVLKMNNINIKER